MTSTPYFSQLISLHIPISTILELYWVCALLIPLAFTSPPYQSETSWSTKIITVFHAQCLCSVMHAWKISNLVKFNSSPTLCLHTRRKTVKSSAFTLSTNPRTANGLFRVSGSHTFPKFIYSLTLVAIISAFSLSPKPLTLIHICSQLQTVTFHLQYFTIIEQHSEKT